MNATPPTNLFPEPVEEPIVVEPEVQEVVEEIKEELPKEEVVEEPKEPVQEFVDIVEAPVGILLEKYNNKLKTEREKWDQEKKEMQESHKKEMQEIKRMIHKAIYDE